MKLQHVLIGIGAVALVAGGIFVAKKYFSKKSEDNKGCDKNETNIAEDEVSEDSSNESDDDAVIEFNVEELTKIAEEQKASNTKNDILNVVNDIINDSINFGANKVVNWKKLFDRISIKVDLK